MTVTDDQRRRAVNLFADAGVLARDIDVLGAGFDELAWRLDVACGDLLGQLMAVHFPPDPAWTSKVPPGDPVPKQPDPPPDPPPDPAPPPPSD